MCSPAPGHWHGIEPGVFHFQLNRHRIDAVPVTSHAF